MGRQKRAAVVTPYFVDHDAVCNDVFHSAQILRSAGWDARVFAAGSLSARERAAPLGELGGFLGGPEDLFYYHFSTGHAECLAAARAAPGRRVLKYHNITPPEFFSLWSDELAEASRAGREQLAEVAALPWERVLGASAYNLTELAAHVRPGTPLEPLAPFQEIDAPGEPPIRGAETPRILTVGRLSPSKGHPFLLRILRYLVHDLGVPATLDIVGKADPRMVSYTRMLALMVREYGLEAHVRFHGEVAAPTLAASYAQASVYLMGSEHEGFCVPLVEAMAYGLPIVALATSAIPETLGDAGIAWETRDARRFAVTLACLLDDADARRELGARGRARYAQRFSKEALRERTLQLLEPRPA